jgi:hypothetical protein
MRGLAKGKLGGSPKQIARELRAFSRGARILSSNRPRLIEEHPKEWIGIYDGKVSATAKSFKTLIAKMRKRGLPPNDAIIRYIDTRERFLVL